MSANESRTLSPNFGKYSVLARWASGGMADVCVARQTGAFGFDKLVALKLLKPEMSNNEHFREMFFAEARTGALLTHPNIVQTLDVGELNGQVYLALEFVNGESLSRLSHAIEKDGKFPVQLALAIVKETALALDYAHSLSDLSGKPLHLIHRDISPSNIMLSHEGAVKLLDFGIAKVSTESGLTKVGTIKGKFNYLSPEAAAGQELDPRSDLFSLGVVFWQLLTGKRAFSADNDLALLSKLLKDELPAPSTHNPEIGPGLDALCMKAVARERSNRYGSAREMAQAFESYLGQYYPQFSLQTELRELMKKHFGARADSLRAVVAAANARGGIGEGGGSVPSMSLGTSASGSMPRARGFSQPSMSTAEGQGSGEQILAGGQYGASGSGEYGLPRRGTGELGRGSGEFRMPGSGSGEFVRGSGEYRLPPPGSGEFVRGSGEFARGSGEFHQPSQSGIQQAAPNKHTAILVGVTLGIVVAAVIVVLLLPSGGDKVLRKFTVTSDPPGAQVLVDGKLIGETPVEVELEPSKAATLIVKKEGFKSTQRDIGNEEELSIVNAVLEAELKLGSLVIESTPSGATVKLDDKPLQGVTPIVLNDLTIDKPHTFVANLDGYSPIARSVSFDPSGKAEYRLNFERLNGTLEARCAPEPCQVYLNGSSVGSTPLVNHPVPVGAAALVQLRVGEKVVRELSYTPESGRQQLVEGNSDGSKAPVVAAVSNPSGNNDPKDERKTMLQWTVDSSPSAAVFFGAKQICAATPCEVRFTEPKKLILKAKGYQDGNLSLGSDKHVSVTLRKAAGATTILD